MPVAAHLNDVTPFLAMEIMERAFSLERQGHSVVHLEIGEPDFSPPPAAIAAAQDALSRGATNYTDSRGLPELRDAIAQEKSFRTGASVSPEQVIVTSGTSPALLMVFRLLVAPGDEVLVPTPHYPCYPNFIRLCGGVPRFVPCDPERGYAIDLSAARAAVGPKTRAIIVGSPANPTGAVASRAELEALLELGLPLISDEIYDGLLYDDVRVTSALELSDQAFVLDGFSKRYAMTGFRLGYVIAPTDAVRMLQTLQQNLFISASEFVQWAGVAALREGAATTAAGREAYGTRRVRLVEGLRDLGFRIPAAPKGAFYVFADARAFGQDSLALALRLLDEAHVAVTPGIDFGAAGEGWLRFAYAVSDEDLDEGLRRLAPVLARIRDGQA